MRAFSSTLDENDCQPDKLVTNMNAQSKEWVEEQARKENDDNEPESNRTYCDNAASSCNQDLAAGCQLHAIEAHLARRGSNRQD